jgi:hypothetical protein
LQQKNLGSEYFPVIPMKKEMKGVNSVSMLRANAAMKIPPKLRNRVMAPTSGTGSVLATMR